MQLDVAKDEGDSLVVEIPEIPNNRHLGRCSIFI